MDNEFIILYTLLQGVKMENTIKSRIEELENFLSDALKEAPNKRFPNCIDWFEVPNELYNKYNINSKIISDEYHIGEVIEAIINELKTILDKGGRNDN